MWLVLAPLASAAPPSSTLTGSTGALSWRVTEEGGHVFAHGTSPRWTVDHEALADLTPVRTVRVDPDGRAVTVVFTPGGATVTLPDRTLEVKAADLWDGETLEIRLGHLAATGAGLDRSFSAIDTASGKVYGFTSRAVGAETCGSAPCTQVVVQLSWLMRLVGPTWRYWLGADGRLWRFEGPAGTFAAP